MRPGPACERRAARAHGISTAKDVDALAHALEDEEPLVREHATWALAQSSAPDESIHAGTLSRRPDGSSTVTAPPVHRGAHAIFRSRP